MKGYMHPPNRQQAPVRFALCHWQHSAAVQGKVSAFGPLQALLRKECGLELAVGPAQLATSAYWTLRGASAFVAGKLGSTVTHVLQSHSMLHMTKVIAHVLANASNF